MSDRLIRLFGCVASVVACAGLFACAHNGDKQAANPLDAIRTISIDPLVVMPDSLHYVSNGQVWGRAIGGGLGAAIAQSASPSHSVRAELEENHIDMAAILIEEVRVALAKQHRFRVVEANADAVLSFTVEEYGFHVAGPFSSKMKVLLDVKSKLISKHGQQVFDDSGSETNEDDTRHSMAEYFDDLRFLLAAFHQVAAAAAASHIDSLTESAEEGHVAKSTPVADASIARQSDAGKAPAQQ